MQDEFGQVLEAAVDLGRPRLPGRRSRALAPGRRSVGPATRRSPTPRSSTPSRCCRGPRGSSRRSSRPTPWPGSSRDRAALAGPDRAGQPVGPGRQGRGPDDGHPRVTAAESRPTTRPCRRSRAGASRRSARATPGRKLLVPYVTGGLGADWLDVVRGRGRRRRRRHRDRHPVLRPGDGRPGHPGRRASGRWPAGATPGRHPRRAARGRRRRAARRHDLLQHRLPHGPRALRRVAGRGRAWPAAILPDLPLEEVGPWARGGRRRRRRDRAARPRPPRPTSGCRASASGPAGSSTPSACSA